MKARDPILCPAKINLWLQVVGKRSDGYHNLWSLMLPIDVYDEMEIYWKGGKGLEISARGFEVPCDQRNVLWKAYELYRSYTGWPESGLIIRLVKNIPVGAGLGGGSSNAAAMLKFLNALNPSPCSYNELVEIAKMVGADVPFFIRAVPAVASGIGDELTVVEGVPAYTLLLIKPPFGVSTAKIYRSLRLTEEKPLISIKAFLEAPWELNGFLQNDLEVVTRSFYPEIDEIKGWLLEEGALGAAMSGSGSTVFGVFPSDVEALRVLQRAREMGKDYCWIRLCHVLSSVRDDIIKY
ncbi:MAG: 4-(cytidine 5'-diphospho)-2-C-methyl-D-erythritol kinase [Syntrophobacterales bacterium]|nr:4-(cytidine 5'-diphospho)-2-C-methyl-D-erythritol kinase [Syntrophobacterales bacterium]